jgi:hypothetical protein
LCDQGRLIAVEAGSQGQHETEQARHGSSLAFAEVASRQAGGLGYGSIGPSESALQQTKGCLMVFPRHGVHGALHPCARQAVGNARVLRKPARDLSQAVHQRVQTLCRLASDRQRQQVRDQCRPCCQSLREIVAGGRRPGFEEADDILSIHGATS